MTDKKWKSTLLKSGVPLEQSVISELKEIEGEQIADYREYTYIRSNEQGIPTVFSVDANVTFLLHKMSLGVQLFIECKYCHDGTWWVFTPEEYVTWLDESFNEAFILIDFWPTEYLSRRHINKRAVEYPLCGKGTEIQSDGKPGAQAIEKAVHQLKYAILEETVALMGNQADLSRDGVGYQMGALIPIIVTTADLWRMRPGVTLEQVRDADELSDIADSHEFLLLKQPRDSLFTRDARRRFQEGVSQEQENLLNENWRGQYTSYRHFAEIFSRYYPSYFFIVNYARFKPNVRKILSIFRESSVVKPRSSEAAKYQSAE